MLLFATSATAATPERWRERLSLDADWRFTREDPAGLGDELSYARLKPWLLATGNEFLNPLKEVQSSPTQLH